MYHNCNVKKYDLVEFLSNEGTTTTTKRALLQCNENALVMHSKSSVTKSKNGRICFTFTIF